MPCNVLYVSTKSLHWQLLDTGDQCNSLRTTGAKLGGGVTTPLNFGEGRFLCEAVVQTVVVIKTHCYTVDWIKVFRAQSDKYIRIRLIFLIYMCTDLDILEIC